MCAANRIRVPTEPVAPSKRTDASEPEEIIPTRWSLLTRLKNWDDQKSWGDFFNTYWKLIYGVATKAGLTDAEAQDVVQETVIAVAKNIQNFRTDPRLGSFKAWLLQSTRWKIADQLKKRPRTRAGAHANDDSSRTSTLERVPDPASMKLDAIWDEEWEKNLVDAALEAVKHQVRGKQYQIFYLNVIKQLPPRKVADALGVSLGQVYLAKHRVSALVKKKIRDLEARVL